MAEWDGEIETEDDEVWVAHECKQIRKRNEKLGSWTDVEIRVDIEDNKIWQISENDKAQVLDVKFCPWCGDKLTTKG